MPIKINPDDLEKVLAAFNKPKVLAREEAERKRKAEDMERKRETEALKAEAKRQKAEARRKIAQAIAAGLIPGTMRDYSVAMPIKRNVYIADKLRPLIVRTRLVPAWDYRQPYSEYSARWNGQLDQMTEGLRQVGLHLELGVGGTGKGIDAESVEVQV